MIYKEGMCQTLSLEFNPDDFIGRLSARFISLVFCSYSHGLLLPFVMPCCLICTIFS